MHTHRARTIARLSGAHRQTLLLLLNGLCAFMYIVILPHFLHFVKG